MNQLGDKFSGVISSHRRTKQLVGLGSIVTKHGAVQGIAVSGKRDSSKEVLIETHDKWHIGSITKPMTATMLARLVEKGVFEWETTIEHILSPTITIHEDWRSATIDDLLTHTAGAPANFPIWLFFKNPKEGSERGLARRRAIANILKKPPIYAPKSMHLYSNVGYTIAGVVAETLMSRSWEDLIREEIFGPLGLDSAGFGPPNDNGDMIQQPRGHQKRLFSGRKASVGTKADNTPIMGPAGSIHMSLADLATFAYEHLLGQRGEGKLLSQQSFLKLHTPKLDDYACGWVVQNDGYLWHNGSNTMWYAFVAFEPELDRVIAVTANDPDIQSCEAIAREIVLETKALFD